MKILQRLLNALDERVYEFLVNDFCSSLNSRSEGDIIFFLVERTRFLYLIGDVGHHRVDLPSGDLTYLQLY